MHGLDSVSWRDVTGQVQFGLMRLKHVSARVCLSDAGISAETRQDSVVLDRRRQPQQSVWVGSRLGHTDYARRSGHNWNAQPAGIVSAAGCCLEHEEGMVLLFSLHLHWLVRRSGISALVKLRWARLVLGLVTTSGGSMPFTPLGPTQPGQPLWVSALSTALEMVLATAGKETSSSA